MALGTLGVCVGVPPGHPLLPPSPPPSRLHPVAMAGVGALQPLLWFGGHCAPARAAARGPARRGLHPPPPRHPTLLRPCLPRYPRLPGLGHTHGLGNPPGKLPSWTGPPLETPINKAGSHIMVWNPPLMGWDLLRIPMMDWNTPYPRTPPNGPGSHIMVWDMPLGPPQMGWDPTS